MNNTIWSRVWSILTPRERRQVWLLVAASAVGGIAQAVMVGALVPFFTFLSNPEKLRDNPILVRASELLGATTDLGIATLLAVAGILALCLSSVVLVARGYAITRFVTMRTHSLSERLLHSYLARPYEQLLARNTSDLGKQILSETGEISSSFFHPASEVVAAAFSILFIAGLLLVLQPGMTLGIVVLLVLIYITLHRFSAPRVRAFGRIRSDENERRFVAVGEIFGGLKDIKAGGVEAAYLARFSDASMAMHRAAWRAVVISEAPRYIIQAVLMSALVAGCVLVLFVLGGSGVSVEDILPALVLFGMASQRMLPEAQRMFGAMSQIGFSSSAVESVWRELTGTRECLDLASAEPVTFQNSVHLNGVSYRYPGSEAGLRNLSLEIRKGERIGIVGGTGAGKTTLVDLLLGLLPPQEGCIEVDGRAIVTTGDIRAWREKVAYVPQSVFLQDGTIAQNIALGVPAERIDMARVARCALAAQLGSFVDGTDGKSLLTMTGDRGVMLSGGQRQRIGIARALYRDAEVIILDEATSALDPETETGVMRAIDALPKKMTIISIAHRLSTLRNCDRLVVMEQGSVIEEGSWDFLASSNGRFSRLIGESGGMPTQAEA